jgi:hypothetical protein
MPKKYTFLLFLISWIGFSQQVELKGKIMAKDADLENVSIQNLTTNHTAISESGGYFHIKVSVNDTLQFSGVQFKTKKVVLKSTDIKAELFFVNLEIENYALKEVVVNQYKNINAVSLGILSKPAKKYSPAERKLNEATTGGGIVPLNPILNAISGRTDMLKKEIEVEKKEYTIRKLNEWFEKEYFTQKFKIPIDYVDGFQYYLAENLSFAKAVKSKNKTLAIFIMGEVANEYLAILNKK